MQGKSASDRQLLDAAAFRRGLVEEGTIHSFLADHRDDLYQVRNRTIATGHGLVGIAAVLCSMGEATSTRAKRWIGRSFCAAQVAERSLDPTGGLERPGVDHWSPAWTLGDAVGDAGFPVRSSRHGVWWQAVGPPRSLPVLLPQCSLPSRPDGPPVADPGPRQNAGLTPFSPSEPPGPWRHDRRRARCTRPARSSRLHQ